jgi:hypothetical protein
MSEIGKGKGIAAKGSSTFSTPRPITVNYITLDDAIQCKFRLSAGP